MLSVNLLIGIVRPILKPKMGNKSKLKISKVRIIIHQSNDNLSVESIRSSKTKILQISNIKPSKVIC